LVFAKSRLRPRNMPISIPNMELMAMVIGVRALTLVRRELRLPGDSETPQFLWGDNKCVLAWINSRKHLPRFVANRIGEIRRHEYLRFAYVETKQNPADIGTRGDPPQSPRDNCKIPSCGGMDQNGSKKDLKDGLPSSALLSSQYPSNPTR
jgi:hypothetical protein